MRKQEMEGNGLVIGIISGFFAFTTLREIIMSGLYSNVPFRMLLKGIFTNNEGSNDGKRWKPSVVPH